MESPCNNICKIDRISGFCIGCGRSLDEITEWSSAPPARQQKILVQLPERIRVIAARAKR
ncbi:DUF1289 domain-containing protein [Parasphingorhabdus sp. JC815]|uniref:DUF1289 domain-containing protein n=1 Tax=Parasphingorhabdus sp. JC815 TaxID=3232140 RepID=UPI00345904C2